MHLWYSSFEYPAFRTVTLHFSRFFTPPGSWSTETVSRCWWTGVLGMPFIARDAERGGHPGWCLMANDCVCFWLQNYFQLKKSGEIVSYWRKWFHVTNMFLIIMGLLNHEQSCNCLISLRCVSYLHAGIYEPSILWYICGSIVSMGMWALTETLCLAASGMSNADPVQ